MPLPQNNTGLSPAASDLGLGDMLSQQVQGETEEQRKKRMLQIQQQQASGSLAVTSLFGMSGGARGAGN